MLGQNSNSLNLSRRRLMRVRGSGAANAFARVRVLALRAARYAWRRLSVRTGFVVDGGTGLRMPFSPRLGTRTELQIRYW